jgi:signal transduction histidine kinase
VTDILEQRLPAGENMLEKRKKNDNDLQHIKRRIEDKHRDYARYNFNIEQSLSLHTFFDLAQEFDSIEDFYRICVAALGRCIRAHCRLHILDEKGEHLQVVCDSLEGLKRPPARSPSYIKLTCKPYEARNAYLVPIQRKPKRDTPNSLMNLGKILTGVLEVFPAPDITEADRFFIKKYCNRIGYNLHNRIIAQQNITHLKFINNLVTDIEHNVITPNMYFKHLFNQLKKRIKEIDELEFMMQEMKKTQQPTVGKGCEAVMSKISNLHTALQENHRELLEHHATYSLFLESLFRRDHFTKGRFVLRLKKCFIDRDIVSPQLEHYASRLKSRGIDVEHSPDLQREDQELFVDVGLLSQVYANLFSNALKYTTEIITSYGRPRKAVAYGRELKASYFGRGRHGIKFNVFTTGERLSEHEAKAVFTDGFRGERGKNQSGTGHGLAFIKQVVEMHGGVVGYEPTEEGNNFYFVLPMTPPQTAEDQEGS